MAHLKDLIVTGAARILGKLYASEFVGKLTGTADNATKLATARNIAISGAVTGNADFDGSGNINISTSVNHGHNYAGSSSAGGDANRAMAIADYGDVSRTINIGFSGPGISGDQIGYIAGYTDNGTKIKDVNKDALRGWIGLGSAAYADSSSFAAANHGHNYAGSSSDGGSANSASVSYSLVDYADTGNKIKVGYNGNSLSRFDFLAAYSTVDGTRVIKDVGAATVRSWLGIYQGTTAPSSLAQGNIYFVYED